MTTKETKERIFDMSSFCAGQVIRLEAEDITILKEAFKGLSKLERIEQIISEISTLTAPKSDTEYQDGFYDCEKMMLDIIDKCFKGDAGNQDMH